MDDSQSNQSQSESQSETQPQQPQQNPSLPPEHTQSADQTPAPEIEHTALPVEPAPPVAETHHTPPPVGTPPPKKSSSALKSFGKIMLGALAATILFMGGYYFGVTGKKETQPAPQKAVIVSPTEAMKQVASPSATVTTKKVNAGLTTASSAFKPYSIEIPEGWSETKQADVNADKLTINKDDYTLTITQAALGGGGCIYKGDAAQPLAQRFTDFTEITGKNTQIFRRSWNQDAAVKTLSYTVCQKADDNTYSSLTEFGRIDAVSPNPADHATLTEIDNMIASMTRQ